MLENEPADAAWSIVSASSLHERGLELIGSLFVLTSHRYIFLVVCLVRSIVPSFKEEIELALRFSTCEAPSASSSCIGHREHHKDICPGIVAHCGMFNTKSL
jgi:hypothetical protein